MFVHFFIDRPVLSIVISILITLVGVIALVSLPVAQYPEISPPSVSVTTSYTGANAQVVEETVAAPIEQQINGAEEMMYMNSTSANDGSMRLFVTFEVGRDLEMATVEVQNRVNRAQMQLPTEVIRGGVSVTKQSPNMLLIINLTSPGNRYDTLFLNNYAEINIADALARLQGVGDVNVFGGRVYGMRVWLDPSKLKELGLTAGDVISAVKEQNIQAPAGQIGVPPIPMGQEFQYTVEVKGRLTEVEEFENIIIRAGGDGQYVRIKDVARVELGAQSYSAYGRFNGGSTTSIIIYQLPGANALEIAESVRATMKELSQFFPEGLDYTVSYDTTNYVQTSVREVVSTLFQALALVLLVVFIFLQNWRATLIPMMAIPVSLVGTFVAFQVFGFSINTLTLFGLILAIGIVVDDAIVVVEATQRNIDENGMTPVEAAKAAMSEVTAPAIANTLVLMAVFVPVAFMGGITGRLYQQFAVTLSFSVALSTVVALTLSPALAALLLKPVKEFKGPLGYFFRTFNSIFDSVGKAYNTTLKMTIRRSIMSILIIAILFAATVTIIKSVPTGYVPMEDQGYFFTSVQLPEGASLERTEAMVTKVEKYLMNIEGVRDVLTLAGFDILTGAMSSYSASLIVVLDDWDERESDELHLNAILNKAQRGLFQMPEGLVMCFNPPPIPGLGTTGGFTLQFQDRGGHTVEELGREANNFIAEARKRPELANLFTPFSVNTPIISVDIDREKAKTLGIPINSIFETMQTFLGGYYINDFNKFGRTYRVMVQGEPRYRTQPQDISRFYVRTGNGAMVPLSSLANVKEKTGPEFIRRFNLYRTVEINGSPAQGYSSGQAIQAIEEVARDHMPQGYGYAWNGMAFQEKRSGGQTVYIMILALIMVFLFLAAQYESWAIPLAVLFTIPLGIFGAMFGQMALGLENNVYAQIGLVMLIGLSAKNAVLIVEFAKKRHEQGASVMEAAMEASRLRFRAILMTSFSFILGVLPLVVAVGAGAASRRSLGTSVFFGMIAATMLGVLAVPFFYTLIQGTVDKLKNKQPPSSGKKVDSEDAAVIATNPD